jgi:hypothetical protein
LKYCLENSNKSNQINKLFDKEYVMINWIYFPKSDGIPKHLSVIVNIFRQHDSQIQSPKNNLASNEVLSIISKSLENEGYKVEKSKKNDDKIRVPVLFGINGTLEKSFEADAYSQEHKTVIEVEAGRGVTNYQFLKDLFQACVMHNVDYLVIAVRNKYRNSNDFEKVLSFFEVLYASGRIKLPLKGILLIGY